MNYDNLPNGVLKKLVQLDEQAEFLHRKNDDLERGIAAARTRLSGTFRTDQEYQDLRRSLEQMIADKPKAETNMHRVNIWWQTVNGGSTSCQTARCLSRSK